MYTCINWMHSWLSTSFSQFSVWLLFGEGVVLGGFFFRGWGSNRVIRHLTNLVFRSGEWCLLSIDIGFLSQVSSWVKISRNEFICSLNYLVNRMSSYALKQETICMSFILTHTHTHKKNSERGKIKLINSVNRCLVIFHGAFSSSYEQDPLILK